MESSEDVLFKKGAENFMHRKKTTRFDYCYSFYSITHQNHEKNINGRYI